MDSRREKINMTGIRIKSDTREISLHSKPLGCGMHCQMEPCRQTQLFEMDLDKYLKEKNWQSSGKKRGSKD